MGFFDFLKAFGFSRFFRQKPRESSMNEVREKVFTELEAEKKSIMDFSMRKTAEIRHLLNALSRSASALEKHSINTKEGNQRYRQIIATSQKNLVRQLKGLSNKLVPPQNPSFETIKEYSLSGYRAVNIDLLPYWKNISLTKLELKEEVNSIGNDIRELSSSLKEMHDISHSKKISDLTEFVNRFNEIDDAERKISSAIKRVSEKKSDLGKAKKHLAGHEEFREAKLASKEASEFNKLSGTAKALELKKDSLILAFNSELAPIEKVLKRIHSVADSSAAFSGKEKELLRLMLESPSSAFTTDPNGLTAKTILIKAEEMVKNDSIPLKLGEKAKRLSAINKLVSKDFFTDCFWSLNNVQRDLVQVKKQMNSLDVSAELKRVDSDIELAKQRVGAVQGELERALIEKNSSEADLALKKQKLVSKLNESYSGTFTIK